MTKEEAIKVLKNIIDYGWLISDMEECTAISACEMAIEALEHEPCDDCIGRKAVLSLQYRIDDSATLSTRNVVNVDDVEDLPSIQPKPKTGHWIDITNTRGTVIAIRCDCCGNSPKHAIRSDFCPNCGAKMIESQGSVDK